jgi:hypothetical protein
MDLEFQQMLDYYHRSFHTSHTHITGILQIFVTSRIFENVSVFRYPSGLYTSQKLHIYLGEPYTNINVVLGSYGPKY